MKIVEYKKIVPKPRHLLKFGGHFEKSALTALSSTGIFAGNLISIALWLRFPKIVVSKNPPGGAGFRLLAHRLIQKRGLWVKAIRRAHISPKNVGSLGDSRDNQQKYGVIR